MSFGEKFASIMERPNQDPVSKDDVPWWMKYAGRTVGTVGGFLAIFLGVWSCFGLLMGSISGFLGGIWQMLAGFIVITIEAPCCCMFVDFVQSLSDWVDRRPYWNRAAGYCGLAIIEMIIDPGLGTIIGIGLVFVTGIIYGMMSLGKKGARPEPTGMASPSGVASPTQPQPGVPSTDHHTTLMEDPDVWRPTAPLEAMRTAATTQSSTIGGTSGMQSNLVDNAQPIGFSAKPDSNV